MKLSKTMGSIGYFFLIKLEVCELLKKKLSHPTSLAPSLLSSLNLVAIVNWVVALNP